MALPRAPHPRALGPAHTHVPRRHQRQQLIPAWLIQNKVQPEMTTMIYHTQPPASQKEGHLNATSAPVHRHPSTREAQ